MINISWKRYLYPGTSPVWDLPAACCSGLLLLPERKKEKEINENKKLRK